MKEIVLGKEDMVRIADSIDNLPKYIKVLIDPNKLWDMQIVADWLRQEADK